MIRIVKRFKQKLAKEKMAWLNEHNFKTVMLSFAACSLLFSASNQSPAAPTNNDTSSSANTTSQKVNSTATTSSQDASLAKNKVVTDKDPDSYIPSHLPPDYHAMGLSTEEINRDALWGRFFGFTKDNSLAETPHNHNNMYMVPHTMYKVNTLNEQTDGSEKLWDTLLYKVDNRNLEERTEYHEQMVDQIYRGLNFVSYLLHLYTPQDSNYNVPLYIIKADDMRQAVSAVDIGNINLSLSKKALSYVKASDISSKRGQSIILGSPVDSVLRGGYPLYYFSQVRDRIYDDGPCAGLTYIEADLKGRCRSEQNYNGLLLLSMPLPGVVKEGVFKGEPHVITYNGLKANFLAQGMEMGSRLVGLNSSFRTENQRFGSNLHSFDKHLFSPHAKQFVRANSSLSSIGKGCSHANQSGHCKLFFVGKNVNRLLSIGNYNSDFDLHSIGILEVGTDEASFILSDADQHANVDQMNQDANDKHGIPAQYGSPLQKAKSDTSDVLSTVSEVAGKTMAIVGVNEANTNAWRDIGEAGKALTKRAEEIENRSSIVTHENEQRYNREIYGETHKGMQDSEVVKALESVAYDEKKLINTDLLQMAKQRRMEIKGQEQLENETTTEDSLDNAELQSATASAMADVRHELYGIPISFSITGKPNLELRNTILSSEQYKNYSMLTELEITLLSDLGYRMEPREFYGKSIYSFGSPDRRIARNVRTNYSYYDHEVGDYNAKLPSRVPLGTGVHIYGSYNDVIHGSKISSAGSGSAGVRIDGSHNYYYQSPKSSILIAGRDGVGLAFTYGANNDAYLSGYIGALGESGIGIKVDMGSNIYSDLIEYRGSYTRVRTLDFMYKSATKEQASELELPDELNGPQVNDLIIDGLVEGKRAAIYIDDGSFVKNIHVTANAVLNGGIYSLWNPAPDMNGKIILRQDHKNAELLDGVVQLPLNNTMNGLTSNTLIDRYLTTNLNLGVMLDGHNKPVLNNSSKLSYVGNDKSKVVLSGDVLGRSININHIAGRSTIQGEVMANNLVVENGVFCMAGNDGAINQLRSVQLGSNVVLDLVNGAGSKTYVQDAIKIGRDVSIRVDVDQLGTPLDTVSFNGDVAVAEFQLTIEPGVSYSEMRRFGADPKALMRFINDFMTQNNKIFASKNISLRFPHYIWDNSGGYGREIKCSPSGCHMGGFVSNQGHTDMSDVQYWRYWLSFGSLLFLFACLYLRYVYIKHRKKRHNLTTFK